jgi:hypothetical protein
VASARTTRFSLVSGLGDGEPRHGVWNGSCYPSAARLRSSYTDGASARQAPGVPTVIGEKESTMRRVMRVIAAAIFVLGTSTMADAQIVTFTVNLSGNQETPPVLTGSFGQGTVTLNLGTQTVSWSIDVFNMPSGTNNAHFHVGGPGIAGPTVVNMPFPPQISNDYNLSGSATALSNPRAEEGIRSWEDFIQSLLGGQMYINIHSNVRPGGEIRGQVIRAPSGPPSSE